MFVLTAGACSPIDPCCGRCGGLHTKEDRQTLRTHIANLRRKLESPEGLSLIGTQHGVSYAFGEQRDSRPHRMPRLDFGGRLQDSPDTVL